MRQIAHNVQVLTVESTHDRNRVEPTFLMAVNDLQFLMALITPMVLRARPEDANIGVISLSIRNVFSFLTCDDCSQFQAPICTYMRCLDLKTKELCQDKGNCRAAERLPAASSTYQLADKLEPSNIDALAYGQAAGV